MGLNWDDTPLKMDDSGRVAEDERTRMIGVLGRLYLWNEFLEGRHGSATTSKIARSILFWRRRVLKAIEAMDALLSEDT